MSATSQPNPPHSTPSGTAAASSAAATPSSALFSYPLPPQRDPPKAPNAIPAPNSHPLPNHTPPYPNPRAAANKPIPQQPDRNVAVANIGSNRPAQPYPYSVRSFGAQNSESSFQVTQSGRPTNHLQQTLLGITASGVKGVQVPTNLKVSPYPSSASDCNGHKDNRDKSKDEGIAIIRGRKAQISDGTSLYGQLRSWVNNGLPDQNQPQYMDSTRSLPKPLPLPVGDANSQLKKDDVKEEEEEIDVDKLSAKELLQIHVNRAKRVRARFREERLQKIERYKSRLALLLPPVVEQQMKNESGEGPS